MRMVNLSIKPLFASSIFTISPPCQIYQVLCYDYADPEGVYERILHDEEAFEVEIIKLRGNMEKFLAVEQVYINGKRVQQEILRVDIGLRGAADVPYIQWVIFFQGPSLQGENTLISDVTEEIAQYDIEVLYLFPAGTRIKRVITPMMINPTR